METVIKTLTFVVVAIICYGLGIMYAATTIQEGCDKIGKTIINQKVYVCSIQNSKK